MKYERCPAYCLFDPESDNPGIQRTCESCEHDKDINIPPRKGVLLFPGGGEVTVTGINGNWYYIEETMSNGHVTHSTVVKSRVRLL